MVSSGTPLDFKERIIAFLEEASPGVHKGKTTQGRNIRVYFANGVLDVSLDPWRNVVWCDEYEDEDISLEKALF